MISFSSLFFIRWFPNHFINTLTNTIIQISMISKKVPARVIRAQFVNFGVSFAILLTPVSKTGIQNRKSFMKKTNFDEIRKIWEFYEELNEIVYVADMDSHELVYMGAASAIRSPSMIITTSFNSYSFSSLPNSPIFTASSNRYLLPSASSTVFFTNILFPTTGL